MKLILPPAFARRSFCKGWLQPCYKHCFAFSLVLRLPLLPVKNWLVIILLIITAAGTFIPCCGADDCCAVQPATTSDHKEHQSEGTCSPFFACATCAGFVMLSDRILFIQPIPEKQVHHERIINNNLSTYTSTFWQPPRSY